MLIRFLDILFSMMAITILLPILLVVSLILLLTGEGKVFYIQKRIGLKNKPFNLIKFATMLENSPNIGAGELTEKDDPRVLPFGKFLRASKINELPQLLNILKGEMSFVGPRPQTQKYYSLYSKEIRSDLYYVKPGLTGIGSIVFRNEEEIFGLVDDPILFDINELVPYKGELESWFSRNISIYLYFKIIMITAFVVIRPNNILPYKLFKDIPMPSKKVDIMLKKIKN